MERDLTARLVDDILGQPSMLPMLSNTLLCIWCRRRGRVLTLADYEAIGGARGTVATAAEEVLDRLCVRQRLAARRVLAVSSPLVRTASTRAGGCGGRS